MAQIFGPGLDLAVRGLLVALGLGGAGALTWICLMPATDYRTAQHETIEQPVPFSHHHHVAGLGLDCRFCHGAVESAANAGMPATETCMTCHSQIWTHAEMLAPVRDSLAEQRPLRWKKINVLPDYVFFDHSIHIAKGVGCASCHGTVAEMPLMQKAAPLTMGWCLGCHRDPAPNLRPRTALFDTEWQRSATTPSGAELMRTYHVHTAGLTDCSTCHR